MGFFSDLKEDLTQAVNELIPEEEGLEAQTAAEEPIQTAEQTVEGMSLEEMLANIDSVKLPGEGADMAEPDAAQTAEPEEAGGDYEPLVTAEPIAEPETAEPENAGSEPDVPQAAEPEPEPVQEPEITEPEPEPEPIAEPDTLYEESHKGAEEKMETNAEAGQDRIATDETAIITEGMSITGDMTSSGSLDVIGNVTGNIDILGKLNITGYITGNSKAAEVYAEGAKINGEVISEGAVKIGEESVIIGNISASYAVIAGAVKGDIDVHGPVLLDSTAIVMGNIRSKSVQINNGAVIEGMCSQCYADMSPTHFFDDYQPKTGKSKKN